MRLLSTDDDSLMLFSFFISLLSPVPLLFFRSSSSHLSARSPSQIMQAHSTPSRSLPAGLDSEDAFSNTTQQCRPPYARRTSSISYSNGSTSLVPGTIPGRARPKWLVAVSPSEQLAAISEATYSGHAVLLPLQASLHAQLAAVAREFGMRSGVSGPMYVGRPCSA